MASSNCAVYVPQLSFSSGDRLLVHAQPSSEWWWAELHGVIGYVPAGYLGRDAAEEGQDTSLDDPWQDEEYFGSYGTLVRNFKGSSQPNYLQVAHAGNLKLAAIKPPTILPCISGLLL